MTTLRVAGYQMAVSGDVPQNVRALCKAIGEAAETGAELLLTPEGSLSGYTPDFDPFEVTAGLAEVTAHARQLGVGLALGTCFKEADGLVYNQVRFYNPTGGCLGFHSKILRCGTVACSSPEEPPQGEINHLCCHRPADFFYQRHPGRRPHLQRSVGEPASALPCPTRTSPSSWRALAQR